MATEKQCEANRQNALLSTGPKTPEGKKIVRINALKHGLRAGGFELADGEDPAEFDARLAGWNRVYLPANQVEADLVRQAVVLSWLLDRAHRFENAALNDRIHTRITACDCEDDDTQALIAAAGLAFFDAGPEGEKLRRYQNTLRRDMLRTLAELAKLRQQTATLKTAAASASEEVRVQEVRPELPTQLPPIKAISSAPNKANPVAPNKANPVAPNKANPVAPNKAISARGVRELERFVANQARRGDQNVAWLDISVGKR